ncbi:MAG: hypothetical protein M3Y35_18285, partial [Actinomycetota bacterium]|nr:hypothetical protein [Actinomycetota bacterium]
VWYCQTGRVRQARIASDITDRGPDSGGQNPSTSASLTSREHLVLRFSDGQTILRNNTNHSALLL